jgi:polar amino acid transport system substrate-binding protein
MNSDAMGRGLGRWIGALALLGAGAWALAAEPPPLRIATGELPPYATEQRPDQGIALHIVRRAFESVGRSVQFTFLPWSRAQRETEQGLWDASAHWGASDERRAKFLLSDNLLTEQWQLLHRREISLDWRRVADLRPYTVGMVRDYTYTPEWWAEARAGRLKVEQPNNDLNSLRMLLAGRIDVLPIERHVACDLLARHFKRDDRARLMMHPRLITESFTTHVIFPPHKPGSEALRLAFNRGLQKLKDSGEYKRLLGAGVDCPADWPAAR